LVSEKLFAFAPLIPDMLLAFASLGLDQVFPLLVLVADQFFPLGFVVRPPIGDLGMPLLAELFEPLEPATSPLGVMLAVAAPWRAGELAAMRPTGHVIGVGADRPQLPKHSLSRNRGHQDFG
jgi:hypothetical protein